MPSLGSVRRVNVLEENYTLFPVVLVGSNTPLPSKLSQHLPFLFPTTLSSICLARFKNKIEHDYDEASLKTLFKSLIDLAV